MGKILKKQFGLIPLEVETFSSIGKDLKARSSDFLRRAFLFLGA